MKRNAKWLAAVSVMAALGLACSAAAMAQDAAQRCDLRLAVTFTPDVPDSQNPGFLGSILSDPMYQLTWLNGTDNTHATMQLTGPGPSSQCQEALSKLSKDAHVLDVKVLQPGETT